MSNPNLASILDPTGDFEAIQTTQEELLAAIVRKQLPIIEAIKVVRNALGVDLGTAKAIITDHPAYRPVAEAAQPLHDDALQALATSPESQPVSQN